MNRCAEFRPLLDSWLDNEAAQGDRDAITDHLENCPDCAAVVEGRKAFRARIRSAVAAAPGADARLKAQVRSHLTASGGSRSRWQYLAIAAAVLVAAGIYGTWRGPGRAMEVGLRQHIHCAVDRTYSGQTPSPAELIGDLGPDYAGLLPVMERNVPRDYRVVLAHHCSYKDRKYIHIVARDGGRLISLLVTRRDAGEAFENDLRAVASEADSDLYSARSKDLSVAGFETPQYFVYLVSNMDEGRNLRVFQAMLPAVKTALT